MINLRERVKEQRRFIDQNLQFEDWQSILPYFEKLEQTELNGFDDVKDWLEKRSELTAVIEEEKAWRYIGYSCYTNKQENLEAFDFFTQKIEPEIVKYNNILDKKLVEAVEGTSLPPEYEIFIRGIRKNLEIYRQENVCLLARIEVEEQKYSAVTGAMSINYKGQELTLPQTDTLLKSTSRKVRKEVFDLVQQRRGAAYDELNLLYSDLVRYRDLVAKNAGFDNYRDFRFAQLNRFDYTYEDCYVLHEAVKECVLPIKDKYCKKRKEVLGVERLYPYDMSVDIENREPLKPFETVDELVEKSINCLNQVDEEFGNCLDTLSKNGYLDLDTRKGKAPGGYNYPLFESNVPFIFMNATNNLRAVVTLMHESGHAVHSVLSANQPLVYFKDFPAEIAELASMSMELMSMEHWDCFFESEDELKQAKREHLRAVIDVLPWVATVDKFQHWVYESADRTSDDRLGFWEFIFNEFRSETVDWKGYETHLRHQWHKQIHLYQFPLYYIEYGIAQIGAIGIWKNYKENPGKTVQQYKEALKLGYTKTLPELYEVAGVPFDFSLNHIRELMNFLESEIDSLA
ncbi:MAG: M3 family oligoendopeptidase [Bacteroidales bacterium]|nr:M3 family oligoendopeptidase [Bacteroidales bacterium]